MGGHNLAKCWATLRGTLSEKDAVSLVFKVFGVCPPEWGRPFFRPILELKSIKRGVAPPYVSWPIEMQVLQYMYATPWFDLHVWFIKVRGGCPCGPWGWGGRLSDLLFGGRLGAALWAVGVVVWVTPVWGPPTLEPK